MTTTTDSLPMRPRGAHRHAAAPLGARPARPAMAAPGAAVDRATDATRAPDAAAFPSRRARRAAERQTATAPVPVVPTPVTAGPVTHLSTVPAVSAPAGPGSTAADRTSTGVGAVPADRATRGDALPSRRSRRADAARRPSGPQGAARLLTQALSLPVRSMADVATSARALPVTATAVVACLFVTVATPQTATAATVGAPAPALGVQEFVVTDGATLPVERDAFTIGRVPPKPAPAAPATPGAADSAPQVKPSARPVAGTIPTAGGFGARWVAGCAACSTNHQGLDFAAATGTPVSAAMSGRVVSAGVLGGYGNQVLLQHADGTRTRYGHLSQIGVSVGQSVTAGQRIGAVGNTGVSTGSHLHFEVIVGGVPVDPARWLQERGLL